MNNRVHIEVRKKSKKMKKKKTTILDTARNPKSRFITRLKRMTVRLRLRKQRSVSGIIKDKEQHLFI